MTYGYHHGVPHGRFVPSAYSGFGASGEDVALDTVQAAAKTAAGVGAGAAAAGTIAGGGAVTGLLTAAGVSAAAVPIVGWVVGGAIAVSAGIVALVAAVKSGKVRRAEAVATARKLGIAEPEKAPGFIVRALKIPKTRRAKLLARLRKRMDRLKARKLGKPGQKRLANLKWQVDVLVALDKVENPKKASSGDRKAMRLVGGQRPVVDPVTEANSPAVDPEVEEAGMAAAEQNAAPTGFQMPTWGWIALAGGVGVVIALAARPSAPKRT